MGRVHALFHDSPTDEFLCIPRILTYPFSMNPTYAYRLVLAGTLALLALNSALAAESSPATVECGKAQILSGDNCPSLVVQMDLSECGRGAAEVATVSCSDKSATASIRSKRHVFQVPLVLEEGRWGSGKWKIAGPVTRENAQPKTATGPKGLRPFSPDEAPSDTKAPGIGSDLVISADFDAYYSYNANRPQPISTPNGSTATAASIPAGNNQLRLYDAYHNQLGLNLAEISIRKPGKEVSLLLDLDFGQQADQHARISSAAGNSVDEVSKHIGQAILTYTPSRAPGLTFNIGKMATHVGTELSKAKDNWQYSRSSIYSFGSPLWHTGVHVGYSPIPNRLAAGVYVYNGWNTIYDNNSAKTLGGQLKYTPSDSWTIVYNYVGGPEQERNSQNQKRLHDLNATFSRPGFSVAADVIMGKEENALIGTNRADSHWRAGTLAVKVPVSELYWVSPRIEYYRDEQGATLGSGASETLKSATVTNGFRLTEGFETRLELRYDRSSQGDRFFKRSGRTDHQATAEVAFLYSL